MTSLLHMLAIMLSIIVLAPVRQTAPAVYVAPYGVASAIGTPDEPKTLAAALAIGGDIWMLPGVYAGDLTIGVAGTHLRSAPGTRARIDGGLTISGAGASVTGLEIYDSSWTNRAAPTPAQQARVISVQAANVTIADCRIHDLAGGIYAFNGAGGASAGLIASHNLIYNIGWGTLLGRGNGHAVYVQNDSAGTKLFQGNILVNQYGFGMHAYGSAGPSAQLDHLTFGGNVQINNRMLLGGGRPLRDTHVTNNRLWNSQLQVGYVSQHNEDVSVTGNWVGMHRLQVQWVYTPTVQLNRIVAPTNDTAVYLYPPYGGGAWDAQSYYLSKSDTFGIDGQGFYSLASWRVKTGWDATSTYTPTLPLANWVDIQAWGPHHARVAVYNWTNAPTVTLDLSSLVLTPGAAYRLVNAENTAEAQTFTAGGPINVPMTGWRAAAPYGAPGPLSVWDSRFAAFLVEPA